jgi:hypothetical protein
MSEPQPISDDTKAREDLDRVVLGGLFGADDGVVWGTIEDLDAAAWDDLSRALADQDRNR